MRFNDVRNTIYTVASNYFQSVWFAEQKMVKPVEPYITIKFGDVNKSTFPLNYMDNQGEVHSEWVMESSLEVNIFSKGKEVSGAYVNETLGDMIDFQNYLDSEAISDLLSANGITIMKNGGVRDLAGIINETLYRYRAEAEFRVFFIDDTKGQYNIGNKPTIPDSSGGGKQNLNVGTGYFTEVVIEEEENNG